MKKAKQRHQQLAELVLKQQKELAELKPKVKWDKTLKSCNSEKKLSAKCRGEQFYSTARQSTPMHFKGNISKVAEYEVVKAAQKERNGTLEKELTLNNSSICAPFEYCYENKKLLHEIANDLKADKKENKAVKHSSLRTVMLTKDLIEKSGNKSNVSSQKKTWLLEYMTDVKLKTLEKINRIQKDSVHRKKEEKHECKTYRRSHLKENEWSKYSSRLADKQISANRKSVNVAIAENIQQSINVSTPTFRK
eukprot:TRINITY_DN8049_c0_g1_i1.p1 TRINITY_DN8049_c0_g1~~TRINITY_DN8049_c0_g1_i1.p1  ORF type:complete len:250 (+),score=14.89 TRINITY_DN8049_c0_g1_i1:470-1219(+)